MPLCKKSLSEPLLGKNPWLVTDEPVEFQKLLVEDWDFRRITDHFRGICEVYFNWIQTNRKMSTCNQLDLEPLGSWPTMPQKIPGHWLELSPTEVKLDPWPCQPHYLVAHLSGNQLDLWTIDMGLSTNGLTQTAHYSDASPKQRTIDAALTPTASKSEKLIWKR